jgi:hypothetical protein
VKKTGSTAVPVLILLGLLLGGCSRQATPAAAAGAPAAAAPQATPAAAAMPGGAQQSVDTVSGEVAETMDASTYTYMRVKTPKGDLWVATAKTKMAVGDKVVVPLESEMRNFHSPSLNRDFPLIYFVTQVTKEGEARPALAVGHGMGGEQAAAKGPVTVKPMAPPAGGSSIADLWAKRAAMAGKPATINGTVVKFNGGILGRNWFHVQDGSGKAADGTNDITVTSDAVAKVGDVVTVTGTVVVDKDFGAGYAYKLMLENGKIK